MLRGLRGAAALVATIGAAACDRGGAEPGGCYRFDRTYFHPFRLDARGEGSVAELSAAPYASPDDPDLPTGTRVLAVPGARLSAFDSLASRMWQHFWYPTAPDSVHLVWTNGFSGPVFALRVAGDSLTGRVWFTSDVETGVERPPEPARAVRVACPAR